ncbi:BamA/TamA family outer membrane protein [Tellurirhabdus bombi]|uniref:BamA/TamA family outer membrane protein n=1 Tax=Tellurirhabdus bombi TaxID=2907205 RepID=UPI001F329DE0|nr:BamA/TamA family outer membrane protein [Tellurirhabdus bombi]
MRSRVVRSGLLILLWLLQQSTQAQTFRPWQWVKQMAGQFVSDTASPAKPRFLLYPTIAYAPETSLELGISSVYLYHAKNDYEKNRLSEAQLFGFVTLLGQYGLNLDHALYGDDDRYFFLGKGRLQKFPLLYYGIGPNTSGSNSATVDALNIQLRERVLRKIRPNFFGGIEADFQRLSSVNFHQPEDGNPYPLPLGGTGSTNIGLGLGLVYDNRHNVMNVRDGFFAEVAYLNYNRAWGSNLNFTNVNVDLRLYRPVREQQVLAWQAFGSFQNGNVPFNQLALLGGEMLMRGYYAGRYRDKNYVATQLEYRFLPLPFSKRLGAAAFVAAGTVAPKIGAFQIKNILPTGGFGVRYFLYPKKDIFLRLDVGFTREGPGFYIFTGESF